MIDRAEAEVLDAYIKPLMGADAEATDYVNEIMTLAYCLLLRRNIVKTRFGAEKKKDTFGQQIDTTDDELNSMIANLAFMTINTLKANATQEQPYKVKDIANIGYYII